MHSRWGRRRPFILLSAVPLGLAFVLLFTPPDRYAGLYLFGARSWLYLCLTVYLVPYNALGSELTLDHHERTSLVAYRQALYLTGLFGGAGAKLVADQFASERTGFAISGLIFGVVMIATMLVTFAGTTERPEFSQPRPNAPRPKFGDMLRNRPFVIMLITYVIYNVSLTIPSTLGAQVAKHWLHAEQYFPFGMMTFLLCGVISVPFWVSLSRRLDKRPTLIISFLLAAAAMVPGLGFSPERVWLLFVCFAALGLAFGGFVTLPFSIIGDTIDYDEYLTGRRREGFYWGTAEFCRKISQGAAFGAIGLTLEYVGYDGQAAEQSSSALLGLKILFVGVPIVLFLLAALAFWRYPLSKERHDEIHREMGRAT
jgi:Na+/melibiose symporter-like transporter